MKESSHVHLRFSERKEARSVNDSSFPLAICFCPRNHSLDGLWILKHETRLQAVPRDSSCHQEISRNRGKASLEKDLAISISGDVGLSKAFVLRCVRTVC